MSVGIPAGPSIALTPLAFQHLSTVSAQPWVLDDLVERRDLLSDGLEYTSWQLDWLDRLDYATNRRGAARAAASWITTPIDSVVMAARLLTAAVEAVHPAEIRYVGVDGAEKRESIHAGNMQFRPLLGDIPLAARLLPLVAAKLGIPYRVVAIPSHAVSAPAAPSLRDRAAPIAARFRNIWRPAGSKQAATLMLWSAGYGARRFASNERARGSGIAVLQRGSHTRVLVPSWRGFRPAGPRIPSTPRPIAPPQASDEVRRLLGEVDEWARLPGAGSVLEIRLTAFVHRVAPVIDEVADALVSQLDAARIQGLAAANPSSIEDFAALLAAERHGGIDRVLLQHGDHLMPYDNWLVTEVQNFEEMWISDATVADHLAVAAARHSQPAPVFRLRSPRVEELVAKARRGSYSRSYTTDPIGYVPSMLVGDSYVVGGGYLDDAWYHRWHLRLLDWMERQQEHRFVWKALPGSDQAVDPIPEVLGRRGAGNVTYETRPFLAMAHELGRAFTDYPSTALYDAVHLELPILAIVFPRFTEVRRSAVECFGNSVRECVDEDAALIDLEGFLDAPPADFVVDPARISSRTAG